MREARGLRLCAAVILAFAAIAGLGGQVTSGPPAGSAPDRIRYRFESLPQDPSVGDLARVVFVVSGLGGSGLRVDVEVDEGLTLEASSQRPRVGADGSREAEIVLELRVLEAGRRVIGDIEVEGAGGSILIPGFSLSAGGRGGSRSGPSAWRWSAPSTVLRFEAFELAIERVDGSEAPLDAAASFSPPPGLSLEPGGVLSWVALALEEGQIALPEVAIFAGSSSVGSAAASALRARSLPAGLEASRAIGRFRAELFGPDPELSVGRASTFILQLSGKGNLPLVLLPEARIELEGEPLPPGSVSYIRVDDARPSGGSYEGSASLHIRAAPPLPGRLSLDFPPLPVVEPGGALSWLSLPRFEAMVAASADPASEGGQPSPFAEVLGAGGLRSSAAAAPGAASGAVAASPGTADAILLEAAQAWEQGDRGRALALLYGVLRRRPGPRAGSSYDVAAIAAACSGELGSGPPLLDALPSPGLLAAIAGALAAAAVGIFLAARRLGTGAAPGLRAAAAFVLALALALCALSVAAAIQRRELRAVLWTDRLLAVPSERAEGSLPILRGTTACQRGQSPGFVAVELADGVSGWVRAEEAYYY